MAAPFLLDEAVRASAARRLATISAAERKGGLADFGPFHESRWLPDTAVIERVARVRGEWRVSLVFAHVQNPLRLIVRHITAHPSRARAALQAHYMCRLAAKDARGTQRVGIGQLRLSWN